MRVRRNVWLKSQFPGAQIRFHSHLRQLRRTFVIVVFNTVRNHQILPMGTVGPTFRQKVGKPLLLLCVIRCSRVHHSQAITLNLFWKQAFLVKLPISSSLEAKNAALHSGPQDQKPPQRLPGNFVTAPSSQNFPRLHGSPRIEPYVHPPP